MIYLDVCILGQHLLCYHMTADNMINIYILTELRHVSSRGFMPCESVVNQLCSYWANEIHYRLALIAIFSWRHEGFPHVNNLSRSFLPQNRCLLFTIDIRQSHSQSMDCIEQNGKLGTCFFVCLFFGVVFFFFFGGGGGGGGGVGGGGGWGGGGELECWIHIHYFLPDIFLDIEQYSICNCVNDETLFRTKHYPVARQAPWTKSYILQLA